MTKNNKALMAEFEAAAKSETKSAPAERDPRTDPILHDVFRKPRECRIVPEPHFIDYEVVEITASRVGIYLRYLNGPDAGCSTRKHRNDFRKWAATAEIIRRGDAQQGEK